MNADFDTVVITAYSGGTDRTNHAYQLPYTITWNAVDGASGYTVYLSTKSDYSDAKMYSVTENSCDVINLLIGTRYYWKAVPNEGEAIEGTFKTLPMTPRYITTDFLQNVRDLGGWTTLQGKKVKQGLIFRGCEFNNSQGDTGRGFDISDADIDLLTNELGIKTEIDFRSEGESQGITESALG